MAAYKEGDAVTAEKNLRKYVATRLSKYEHLGDVKPGDIDKLPGWMDDPDTRLDDSRSGGYREVHRIGWTRETILDAVNGGKAGSSPILPATLNTMKDGTAFMKLVTSENGAFMANEDRIYNGVVNSGVSWMTDATLGAVGIFGAFRRINMGQAKVAYFDPSILLRTDVYVIGKKGYSWDSYGDWTVTRHNDPYLWGKEIPSHSPGTGIGATSSYQLQFRHGINLRAYLYVMTMESQSDADMAIELCKAKWGKDVTFGPTRRKPEQVFVTGSNAKWNG